MRSRPLGTLAVVIAAAVAIACGTSQVADDAEVTVSGSLTMPDGAPAAGVDIALVEQPTAFAALFEIALLLGSLGTLCAAQALAICEGVRTTTTDNDGRYSFTMKGSESKTVFGNPGRFVLTAQLPPPDGAVTGPSVDTRFKIDQEEIVAPEIAFWKPENATVEPGPEQLRYSMTERGGRADYTVVVTDGDDVVWSEPGGPEGQLDSRAVADLAGALHVTAAVKSEEDGVTFRTSYHSQRVAFQGVLGPPRSRLASCEVGEPAEPVSDPCQFTDGLYAPGSVDLWALGCPEPTPTRQKVPDATPSPTEACTVNRWVSVDLGVRQPVGTVFVHGLRTFMDGPVAVETSDDRVEWTPQAVDELAAYDRIDLPAGTNARYVRLWSSRDSKSTIQALTEFSVWP